MGVYRFVFTAQSNNHGCMRHMQDGSKVFGCGLRSCPDCEMREFVQRMREKGQSVQEAVLVHYPDTPRQTTDNLLTRIRRGGLIDPELVPAGYVAKETEDDDKAGKDRQTAAETSHT